MIALNEMPKGPRMEYLAASVMQSQGYVVRQGLPLKVGPDRQDSTDLDVYGIKFVMPYQPTKVLCDCKDRARSKPFERVFWAKGLGGFLGATELYVALPKCSMEIVDFAKSVGVRVLTRETMVSALSGSEYRPYGVADQMLYEPIKQTVNKVFRSDGEAKETAELGKRLFVVGNPYVDLNACISYIGRASNRLRTVSPGNVDSLLTWRHIVADLVTAFSVILLYIASDTIGLDNDRRLPYVRDALTYGNIPPATVKSMLRLIDSYVDASIRSADGDIFQARFPLGTNPIPPPAYSDDVSGLAGRAVSSPGWYHQLPTVVDYLMFQDALPTGGFDQARFVSAFPRAPHADLVKAARNVFLFLRATADLPLDLLWPNLDKNLPKLDVAVPPSDAGLSAVPS